MRGEFMPGLATDEIRKDVAMQTNVEGRRRVTEDVPWGELNRLSADRRGQRLAPEEFRRRRQETPETNLDAVGLGEDFIPAAAVPVAQPAPSLTPLFSEPAPAPAATRQPPAPELMGGNLIDRLRNMEIFQRQQQ